MIKKTLHMQNHQETLSIDIDTLKDLAKRFFGKEIIDIEYVDTIINWKVILKDHPAKIDKTFNHHRKDYAVLDVSLVTKMSEAYTRQKVERVEAGLICGRIYFQ